MKTVGLDGDVLVYRSCFSVKDGSLSETCEYCDLFIRDLLVFCETESLKIFLTGTGNFRDKIAVTKKYKGSRTKPKPEHYQGVRDYLVNNYSAEIINGYEADDALGVLAGADSIIATVDKDLQQIAGFHLNFYKSRDQWQIKEVTKEEGDRFFWYQCLQGDVNDDIVGVPGLGPKKIEKLFDGKSNDELKGIVMDEFIRYYKSEGFNRFDETARLIFIKRESLEMEYYNYYK